MQDYLVLITEQTVDVCVIDVCFQEQSRRKSLSVGMSANSLMQA